MTPDQKALATTRRPDFNNHIRTHDRLTEDAVKAFLAPFLSSPIVETAEQQQHLRPGMASGMSKRVGPSPAFQIMQGPWRPQGPG